MNKMAAVIHQNLTELCAQVLDYGCLKTLLSNTKTLRQILEEAMSLLKMFWRAALPSSDHSVQNLKKVRRIVRYLILLLKKFTERLDNAGLIFLSFGTYNKYIYVCVCRSSVCRRRSCP